MHTFGSQGSRELGRVDVVKAAFDVQEKGGDFKVESLEEANFMGEGCRGVEGAKARDRAGWVGMEEGTGSGNEGEAGGRNAFHDLGEGFEEDDDPEGGG